MVPEGRGDATRDVWTIGEAALRPVSLVCGAGGDRASSRAGLLNAGGRSSAQTGSVDDLPRIAAQCRHSKRWSGVSRDDSAMACRPSRSPAKAREACDQHDTASLCGGTTGWRRRRSQRGCCAPVSYTHLRAHETGRNLVCRLLLEKKKKK